MLMSILLLSLLVVAIVAGYRAHRSGRRTFRLAQFRPAAPLVGVLPDEP